MKSTHHQVKRNEFEFAQNRPASNRCKILAELLSLRWNSIGSEIAHQAEPISIQLRESTEILRKRERGD
ncbi:MAG: hypothetical protein N3B10_06945 [Armatimonadetes bacterium]|nr:hypothetical protein [Armatimonadota bacterium]MCX7968211.1 hypothetical protein [Armatimonadota bacterium]MDW8143355.1 hypothetical protein [Armatimonadota bacterium]